MMNLITILLAIVAITMTIYASENLRKKSQENKNSLMKYLFDSLDEIFFSSTNSYNPANEEQDLDVFQKNSPFDKDNPLHDYIGFKKPLWLTDAKLFWLDLTAVNNTKYGEKLRNRLAIIKLSLIVLGAIPFALLGDSLSREAYLNLLLTLPLVLLFLYFIFNSFNKLSDYQWQVTKAIYTSNISFLFTKTHMYDMKEKTFYEIENIDKFVSESSEKEDKLFIYTSQNKILLLHYPIFYKEKLLYSIDFKDVVEQLNNILSEYKTSEK